MLAGYTKPSHVLLSLALMFPLTLAGNSLASYAAEAPATVPQKSPAVPSTPERSPAEQEAINAYNEGVRLFLAAQSDANLDARSANALTKQAETKFKQAIKANPLLLEAHSNLGYVEMSRKRYRQAKPYFESALALNKSHEVTLAGYAVTLQELGETAKAISILESLTAQHPESDRHWFNLGSIYQRQQNVNKASQAYLEALKINPKHQPSQFNLATLYHQNKSHQEAWVYYERCIETDPGTPLALQAQHRLNTLTPPVKTTMPR
jgi:tetratricopeptide (TPR) repeat protein